MERSSAFSWTGTTNSRGYLLRALAHDDAASLIVLHGPVSPAHHLEDVVNGVVHVAGRSDGKRVTNSLRHIYAPQIQTNQKKKALRMNFAIVVLGVHDDDEVR